MWAFLVLAAIVVAIIGGFGGVFMKPISDASAVGGPTEAFKVVLAMVAVIVGFLVVVLKVVNTFSED